MNLDKEEVKSAASGRWTEILRYVCDLTDDQLNPKRPGPCPKCGGKDRFQALPDVETTGALFCRQCFSKHNGDGFSAIQWMRDVTFNGALKLVAEAIGYDPVGKTTKTKRRTEIDSRKVQDPIASTTSTAAKPKTVHATPERAIDASAWSLNKEGILESQRVPDMSWTYHKSDGSEAGRILRWNLPDGRKEIRQISPTVGEKQKSGWSTTAMPEPRPLYRLPELLNATEVWVFEGEKAAEAAAALGIVTTTSSGGAGAVPKTDWSSLEGKSVFIVPDNDDAGETFVEKVIEVLRRQAPNARIEVKRLIEDWSEIPVKGDIFEWLEHFRDNSAEALLNRLRAIPNRIDEFRCQTRDDDEDSIEEPRKRTFEGKSIIQLWPLAETPVDWLVEDIIACNQPTIFGAKQKSLKTTLLVDLAVSLASGLPWLDKFRVPRRRRVLFLNGESSERAAAKKIKRAMLARNLRPEDLDGWLRIEAIDFPSLPHQWDCLEIKKTVEKYEMDVIILDPLYMALQGVNTSNLTEVGPAMRNFMAHCRPAELICAHHVKKSASYDDAPELDDLSQAGIAEFAGNYWLMGRDGKYQGGGDHHLAIRYGGRDEQFGLLRLEFDEQKWEARFSSLKDHREDRRRHRETEKINALKMDIMEVLRAHPDGMPESKLASEVNTKAVRENFRTAIKELESQKSVVAVPNFLAGNKKRCRGWKAKCDNDDGHLSPVTVLGDRGNNVLTTDAVP